MKNIRAMGQEALLAPGDAPNVFANYMMASAPQGGQIYTASNLGLK